MNISNRVLTTYQANTSQAKNSVKQLSRAEQQRNAKLLGSLHKQAQGYDKQISMLKKVAVGVAALAGAVKLASASWDTYQKRVQLRTAAAGINIRGLQKAAHGLITETEALSLAAANQNTVYKLSQKQLETVTRGMLALRKEGNDFKLVQQQVTKALVEGKFRGLDQFGLGLTDLARKNHIYSGSADASKMIIKALGDEAAKQKGNLLLPGDAMKQAAVTLKDAVASIKESLGSLLVSLAPVVRAFSSLVAKVASLPHSVRQLGIYLKTGEVVEPGSYEAKFVKLKHELAVSKDKMLRRYLEGRGHHVAFRDPTVVQRDIDRLLGEMTRKRSLARSNERRASGKLFVDTVTGAFDQLANFASGAGARRGRGRGARHYGSRAIIGQYAGADPLGIGALGSSAVGDLGSLGAEGGLGELLAQEDRTAILTAQRDRQSRALGAARGRARTQSRLAMMFGPLDELRAYQSAFTGLSDAVTSGFDAWISGSKSFATAFKNAIGAALKADAIQMLGQAIKHGAFAIGSLAFADFRGAAEHGLAAAKFAAGAIAIGGLAKELGAGGVGGRGAGSVGAPHVAGGRGGGFQNRSTIVIADGLLSGSARQRAARVRRVLGESHGAGGDPNDVAVFS